MEEDDDIAVKPDSISAIECVPDVDSNKQSSPKTYNYDESGMLQCPHCNFKTHMPKQYESHLACHTRLRDQMFQCDICHMKFSQKANMNRHRMRHSGFKPYQCSICSKRFFRRDHMRTHEVTHYDGAGRRFECPLCDSFFTRVAVLRHHLDSDHPIGPGVVAQCKMCAVAFSSTSRLLTHYQSEHESPIKDETVDTVCANGLPTQNYEAAMEFRTSLAAMVASSLDSDNSRGGSIPVMNSFEGQQSHSIEDAYSFDNAGGDNTSDSGGKGTTSQHTTPNKLIGNMRSPTMELFPGSESPSIDGRNSTNVEGAGHRCDSANVGPRFCSYCEIQFNDRTLYFLHKGLHAESNPWKCNLCGEICGDKYTFHTHLIGAKHS